MVGPVWVTRQAVPHLDPPGAGRVEDGEQLQLIELAFPLPVGCGPAPGGTEAGSAASPGLALMPAP